MMLLSDIASLLDLIYLCVWFLYYDTNHYMVIWYVSYTVQFCED